MEKIEINVDVITGEVTQTIIPLTADEITIVQAGNTQAQKDACKEQAKALLAQTDWAVLPDVGLKNFADYVTYRGILRGLVISPVETPDFPLLPTPIWS